LTESINLHSQHSSMKYYLIAGEASGDLHGANLIKELLRLDAAASVRCWGGDKMDAAGATLVKHYRDLAFMGFVEVIKNIRTIFKNLSFCKQDILAFKPDVLVLIDYPGFNLRIAKWARSQGIKVVYYISPQVWAWKENRVKSMKLCVDKMICILPFEKKYYKERWNWDVEYVGHPLVKVIDDFRLSVTDSSVQKNIIAVLPGSRKQEILTKLPIMLQVSNAFPAYEFVVAKSPGIEDDFYKDLLAPFSNVSAVANQTYALLSKATAAIVTSGTATLETALFGVPEVICYKGNAISYRIARLLVKIKFICLVNLILDKEVVKELIQDELTVENISKEMNSILNDPAKQLQLKTDYADLKKLLSEGGDASAKTANIIVEFMSENG
jgi:lipid-A-disaccharide synthase